MQALGRLVHLLFTEYPQGCSRVLWRNKATPGWLFSWASPGFCSGRTGLVPAPEIGCMAMVQIPIFRGKVPDFAHWARLGAGRGGGDSRRAGHAPDCSPFPPWRWLDAKVVHRLGGVRVKARRGYPAQGMRTQDLVRLEALNCSAAAERAGAGRRGVRTL